MVHLFFGGNSEDSPQSPSKRPFSTHSPSSKPTKRPKSSSFHQSDEQDVDDSTQNAISGPSFSKSGAVTHQNVAQAGKKKARREEAERLLRDRMLLPIWEGKDKIVQAVKDHDTIVILGETGSGKTTQVPQFLLESSPTLRVCCTQPRRVAATSLATRVAAEVGCQLGSTVGYTIRFDDKSNQSTTRLKFMTDGTLLSEMLGDQDLMRYDVVVLDEAHERSLRTDMLMGFLKDIQVRRKEKIKVWLDREEKGKGKEDDQVEEEVEPHELKIVVMSATIDAKRFSEFFDNAPVLYIKGRQHKVKVHYSAAPITDYVMASVATFFQIHHRHPPGDILIFLPGQDDIETVAASIQSYLSDSKLTNSKQGEVLICPLYAKLPQAEQLKAFNLTPPNTRKVILATNVAETSVTIPGIKFVVDTGLAKEKEFHASAGVDSLVVESISQSSAQQRTGRAGRDSSGHCFRLYTEESFLKLPLSSKPEIQRVSLTYAILHLLASGQEDVWKFNFMDRPSKDAITAALLTLHGLEAIDQKGAITQFGHRMSLIPLDPPLARALLSSFSEGCSKEMIDLVSLISARDTLLINNLTTRDAAAIARQKFNHKSGDHFMLLNILRSYEDIVKTTTTPAERRLWCRDNFINFRSLQEVLSTRKQLTERCERMGLKNCDESCGDAVEPVLGALVAGLFGNTAIRQNDGTYRHAVNRQPITIHPGSIMYQKKAPAIIYDELVQTVKVYARGVSAIQLSWIKTKAPTVFGRTANF